MPCWSVPTVFAKIIADEDMGLPRAQSWEPWVRLASFLVTLWLATRQRWSARELAWSFWMAGLMLGGIYLLVNQAAESLRQEVASWRSRITSALQSLAGGFFLLLFAYAIFAGFLDVIFTMIAWDLTGAPLEPVTRSLPATLSRTLTERWPFLITSGLSQLPAYVRDALSVDSSDFTRFLFVRDLLRMIVLIFILVPLVLFQLGFFALYPVLFVYFLPLDSLRQIGGQIAGLLR